MRVPLSWLRALTDWPGTAEELATALTSRGLTVEAVERPAAGTRGLRAATLLAVEAHRGADRLRVCTVESDGEQATVVSGAPNLRTGTTVLWAPPGAVLPHGRVMEARNLHGVMSAGMLCAEDEVGLPGGHAGVCVLNPGDLPGDPEATDADIAVALYMDDPILVLELTANYATHCQSLLGVAREVAAFTGGELRIPHADGGGTTTRRPPPYRPSTPDPGIPLPAESFGVDLDAPDLCTRYVARLIAGLRAERPAPLWMRQRLAQCGMRPVSGIVDITNFVMLELGQPLHAFDLAHLAGPAVRARRGRTGESLVTLDGRTRTLDHADLVIADADGPVAIAGVMGGQRTEVGASTTAILLESASFAPEAVARTARRLGLPSEAAARFGRGVDPAMVEPAADRAVGLLTTHLGGTPSGRAEALAPDGPRAEAITLRGARVRSLLGVALSTAACGRLLQRYGFGVQPSGSDRLSVIPPSWRHDVAVEVDLVEEVARAHGYAEIPAALPPGGALRSEPSPLTTVAARARAIAMGAGYTEVQPYSFHDRALWDRMRLPEDHPWRHAVTVENPMNEEQSVLRTTLAGGLLRTMEFNARHGRHDAAIFEVGRTFLPRMGDWPDERLTLGAAATGALRAATWQYPAEPADFFALKGLCEEILVRLGVPQGALRWQGRPEAYPLLHPGRSAEIQDGDATVLGWVGEIHPDALAAFELRAPAAIAELDLAAIQSATRPRPVQSLPPHPPTRRDLALVVPLGLPAADVEAAIRAIAAPWLTDCRLFDVFTGAGVPEGHRSLAYALTYQDPERTLTDADVDRVQADVCEQLQARWAIRLRR